MNRAEGPPPRRRYHFHAGGIVYIAVTIFLLVGAINSQNNLLFAGFGLAIGGLVVSGLVSGAALMGVCVERHAVADAPVGQAMPIRYVVRNRNRLVPVFALHITEADDNGAGWPGFFPTPHAFVAHVGPGESIVCESVAWPRSRGVVALSGVRVWSTFPFGVARKSVTFPQVASAVARPPVLVVRPGLLHRPGTRAVQSRRARRARGGGEEFLGVREYSPGDRLRDIAWRPSARTGELVVSQTGAPDPSRLLVALRFARTDRSRVLEERAIALAASLVGWAHDQGLSCGLSVAQAGVLRPIQSGRWHTDRLLNELALLDTDAIAEGGRDGPVPSRRDGVCVVVWAGAIERGRAPAHARHLGAADLPLYLDGGDELLLPPLLRGSRGEPEVRGSAWRWLTAQARRQAAPVGGGVAEAAS